MRVLCLTTFPVEAACTRYRCTQYFDYLRRNGVECELRPFLSAPVFSRLYDRHGHLQTALRLTAAALKRTRDLAWARKFDMIFIQREAALFGPPVVEWLLARAVRKPVVFDFDDAIYLPYVSPTYGRLATWLKCAHKTAATIRLSRHVIAGNRHLARYARNYSRNVSIIPTVVDTELYRPENRDSASVPTIGWIGSPTTTPYLKPLEPVLEELSRRERFTFKSIGANESFALSGAQTINQPWRMEREVADFQSLDIGLYPVSESPWSAGKSGFKAIQYMAAGVACVASPVGVNLEIVKDGINGLFAATPGEWMDRLLLLLRNPSLRRTLALAGRKTVEDHYSLQVHAPRLLAVLNSVAREARCGSAPCRPGSAEAV